MRLCRGNKGKGLCGLREGPLPVPESPGRERVICVIEANGKCVKGMLGAEQRRKIDKYADLTPGIIQPVLIIAGRFHTGSVQRTA